MSGFWASRIPLCRYKGLFGNNWKTMPGCAGRASASSAVVMFRLGPRMIDNCCSDFSLSLAILNLSKTKAVHLFKHMRVHKGHFAVKQKNHLAISCCILRAESPFSPCLEGSPLVLVIRRAGQSRRSPHFTMGEQYLQCSPPPCLHSPMPPVITSKAIMCSSMNSCHHRTATFQTILLPPLTHIWLQPVTACKVWAGAWPMDGLISRCRLNLCSPLVSERGSGQPPLVPPPPVGSN